MSKPEWGAKHTCQSCGAKYYDLNRTPVVCPKCNTEFDPDALLRSRRIRTTTPRAEAEAVEPKKPAMVTKAVVEEEAEVEEDVIDEESEALVEDEEADEDVIEDASELGEDDDDMAEVVIEDNDTEDR